MKASAIRWRVRQPPRSSVELALKAAVAAALAIWASEELGLQDSYWAGISAVVAAAGTLGASLDAAVSRIAATAIGLLVGLTAVALPVSGTLVDAVAVFVALLVLAALSLDAGARLGGATTLLLTAVPGHDAVRDALSRGANVPLGCACAIAIGLVVVSGAPDQQAPLLLSSELTTVGETFDQAARTIATGAGDDRSPAGLEQLSDALASLDAGFADARMRRATVRVPTEELTRLMSVIRTAHGASAALAQAAAPALSEDLD